MVSVPTIDVPTAIVAAGLAIAGNWLKDEFFRWRQKMESDKKEKIEWYEETIHICEQINTTYSILEKLDLIRSDAYQESLVDDAEQIVHDFWEETDSPLTRVVGEDPPEEMVDDVIRQVESQFEDGVVSHMLERIKDDVENHFIDVRNHFASRPREISEDQFEIDSLITSLFLVRIKTELGPYNKLSDESIAEDIELIIQTCKQQIDELT